jgi:predicted RecA/RadA family phage recombinase
MAKARFIQDGKSIDYTPSSAVTAGAVVVQGELIGIAKLDMAAGQLGALAVVGIFDVPKATGAGTDIAAGAKLYWNAANSRVEKTDGTGTHKYMGKAVRAAATTDTTVRVRLEQ